MHLVHAWHNFPTKLSGSADTCWYFIYFVLKAKQSKNTKCLTYFLQSFGLIMLGIHYLKNHREKEMSVRTFPHHGGRHVNSYWVKISPMWRADWNVLTAFPPWAYSSVTLGKAHNLTFNITKRMKQQPPSQGVLGLLRVPVAFPTI